MTGQAINTGYATIQCVAPTQASSASYTVNLAQLTNHTIHSLVTPVIAGLNNNFYSGSNATEQNVLSGAGNFYAGLGKDVLKGTGLSASPTSLQAATNMYANLASKNAIQFIIAGRDVNVYGNVTNEGSSAADNLSVADSVYFDSSNTTAISQTLDLSVTDGKFESVINSDGNTTAYFDGTEGFWSPTNNLSYISNLQSVKNFVFAPGASSGVIHVDTMTVHGNNENIMAMSDPTTAYAGTMVVNIQGELAPSSDTNAGQVVGGTGNNIQGGRGNLIVTTNTDDNSITTGAGAYNFIYETPGTLSTDDSGTSINISPSNTNSNTNGNTPGSYTQRTVIDNFGSYAKNTIYLNAGTTASVITGLGENDLVFNGQAQTVLGTTFNNPIYSDIYETDATQQSGVVFFNFIANDNGLAASQTTTNQAKAGNVLSLIANMDSTTGALDSITMNLGNGVATNSAQGNLQAITTNDTITTVLHLLNQTTMNNLASYNASTNLWSPNSTHQLSTTGGIISDNSGVLSTYFSQNPSSNPNDLTQGIVDNTKSAGSWQDIHIQFWNQDSSGNLTAAQSYLVNAADLITQGTIKV